MSEPTERDREVAVDLLRAASADGLIEGPAEPGKQPEMVERIAAALAAERARARAPFLALADECEAIGNDRKAGIFKRSLNRAVGLRIRRAASGE